MLVYSRRSSTTRSHNFTLVLTTCRENVSALVDVGSYMLNVVRVMRMILFNTEKPG